MNKLEVVNQLKQLLEILEDSDNPEDKVEKFFTDFKEYRADDRSFEEKNQKSKGIYMPLELIEKIERLCEGSRRGFMNFLLVYAINDFMDRYGEEILRQRNTR
ncbi:hypothetical protein SOP94_17175 [Peribacillus frigoritolerans]|uniref:hypothetical protein n=1 Tax=Peribacillus frigoritolerans TaxID=450367 RepID=UPI002B24F24C|nr:hypothetical protein [Peribacillus frigoritolerans]MEB2630190.1 hypothetical protein [Peribacillus frigoritolerans]